MGCAIFTMPPTEDIEETLKKAKMKRRNGKSTLTRLGKVIIVQIGGGAVERRDSKGARQLRKGVR